MFPRNYSIEEVFKNKYHDLIEEHFTSILSVDEAVLKTQIISILKLDQWLNALEFDCMNLGIEDFSLVNVKNKMKMFMPNI